MSADVSVVIVTYNSRAFVGQAIESVREQTRGVSHEIIVVDNASPDDTGAYVAEAYPDVTVLHMQKNIGLSAAINDGVAASTGTCVMQLNPDCRLDGDALSALAAYLREHPDVGVAAPKLLNDDGSVQLSRRSFPGYSTALFSRYSLLTRLWPGNPVSKRYLRTDIDIGASDAPADVDWVSGAAMMFPRAVFDRLGGWDAGFFLFSEDVDFCKRVHDAGLRVVYLPAVRVYHTIGISKRPTTRAIVERHRSMWRYYQKHLRRSFLQDLFTAPAIAVRCLFALVGGWIKTQRHRGTEDSLGSS
jgi:GT2 family glycosyltransferase